MGKPYELIIWDWNGTLLDDPEWCMKVVDSMLKARGLKPLVSIDEYKKVFCFPVKEYYKKVGFDFNVEPFEILAVEYMDRYHSHKTGNCGLYEGAEDVLRAIKARGLSQIILSASEIGNLKRQLREFDIAPLLDDILGISDIYASSKVDIGLSFIARAKPGNMLLIGDTVHDFEVARALGAECLLIANGHQNRETLLGCGVPVINDISEVLGYI